MKRYLELLKKEPINPDVQSTSQKGNIFEKLGDDIKIVTHCGKNNFDSNEATDEKVENEKLMSEFYLYQILASLNLPTESTRLASIDYRYADGNPAYNEPKLAFFREPKPSLAKRCGLLTKPPIKDGFPKPNNISEFQAMFVNSFIINNDFDLSGHNINKLYDTQGDIYFSPYDFDLAGLVLPEYFKNEISLEKNYEKFLEFLKYSLLYSTLPTVKRTLAARSKMQAIITKAQLSPERKKLFKTWLDTYMTGLDQYVNKTGIFYNY